MKAVPCREEEEEEEEEGEEGRAVLCRAVPCRMKKRKKTKKRTRTRKRIRRRVVFWFGELTNTPFA